MKLRMSDRSLFALLLRSPWWISFALAGLVVLLALALVPREFAPYAASGGLPFAVIGCIALSRQWRQPGSAEVERILQTAAAMSWREFAAAVQRTYEAQGYQVRRLASGPDFEVRRGQECKLVFCKRWKAAHHGSEVMREVAETGIGTGVAHYLSLSPVSGAARRYAAEHRIELIGGVAFAQLLRAEIRRKRA